MVAVKTGRQNTDENLCEYEHQRRHFTYFEFIILIIRIINRWKMPENTARSAKIKRSGFLPPHESASLRVEPDAKNRCT
jgi:hypothetical protein